MEWPKRARTVNWESGVLTLDGEKQFEIPELTAEIMEQLAAYTLVGFHVKGYPVTDELLAPFAGHKSMANFGVEDGALTDACFPIFSTMLKLRYLLLDGNAAIHGTLIVFNTCTREYEEVMVTEEVYRTYCRTRWNIKDNDQSFFDHEIQTSGMIGSQDGTYENFREFIDAINTPEHIILEQMKKEALYQAISALPAADQALVQGLFFKGQSELDYAREIGVSQPAVHKRKVRILKSLKKLLEN